MSQEIYLSLGVLISHTLRSESDLLTSIITSDGGKLNLYVRAAKQSKRRFSGKLDLFDLGIWKYTTKGDSIGFLKQFQRTETFFNISNSYPSLIGAYLMTELYEHLITHPVASLIEGDGSLDEQTLTSSHSQTFTILHSALTALNTLKDTREILKTLFMSTYSLLNDQGYGTSGISSLPSAHRLNLLLNHCEVIIGRRLATKKDILQLVASIS